MPSIDAQTFRIRRQALGITQERLSDESGIGLMTIKRIEATPACYPCRAHTLRKIALALSLDADELLYDGVEHVLDIGGDVEVRLSRSTSEAEINEGAEALASLVLKRLRLIKNDHEP